jgi:hypothetical protein
VTAADHHNVEILAHRARALIETGPPAKPAPLFHVKHHLPMHRLPNKASSMSSTPARPVIRSSSSRA